MTEMYANTNGEDSLKVGHRLRARRKELNLTQGQVAEAIGCTPQQIQKYEVGRSRMTIPVFLKICQALHAHPNRFFSTLVLSEGLGDIDSPDLEKRLLDAFRSVDNEKIRERIVNLVEALISTS